MERIDEIKRMLVKKATGFTTGGFKPTNSNSESWIGRVCLYKEEETIPTDNEGKMMFPLLQVCLDGLPYIPDALKGTKVLTVLYLKIYRQGCPLMVTVGLCENTQIKIY